MAGIRVPLHGAIGKFAVIERDATIGAVVGLNLLWPDGSRVTEDEIRTAIAAGQAAAAGNPSGSYTMAQTDARVSKSMTDHLAADDPHDQYLTAAEGDAAYEPLGTVQAFVDAPALTLANLENAVDDAAAATAGVAVGALYRNGSVLQIRVT